MSERVGVVGDPSVAGRLREAGASVVTGDDVPETDRVVAVGQAALSAVAAAPGDPLVVPVEAGRGVRSVAHEAVPAAVAALPEAQVESHPVFEVEAAGDPVGTAFWDVTAVTAEAARISEYAVGSSTDAVGQFRADGVVMATPAGSPGYAHRVGGPVLAPNGSAGAVTPIAPFQTDRDHWVLSLDGLTVSVERDEATVALFVDGESAATVARGETVRLSRAGHVRLAVVDESRSRFH